MFISYYRLKHESTVIAHYNDFLAVVCQKAGENRKPWLGVIQGELCFYSVFSCGACWTGGELSSVGLVGRGCSLSWWGGSCVDHRAKSSAFLPPRLTFSTPTCHPHAEKICSRPTLAATGWGCSEGAVGGWGGGLCLVLQSVQRRDEERFQYRSLSVFILSVKCSLKSFLILSVIMKKKRHILITQLY